MQALTASLAVYGLLLVSASAFLDEGGLPIPSFAVLLLAGAIAYAEPHLLLAILGAAMVASLAADLLWYGVGRRFGRGIQKSVCRLSLSPDTAIRQSDELYGHAGPSSLLVVRYLPGLTNLTMTRAAIARTPFVGFFLFNLAGLALYYALPLVLGFAFHRPLGRFVNAIIASGWRGAALILGAMLLYAAGRWWERRTSMREHQAERVHARKLIAMIERRRRVRAFALPIAAVSRKAVAKSRKDAELIPG